MPRLIAWYNIFNNVLTRTWEASIGKILLNVVFKNVPWTVVCITPTLSPFLESIITKSNIIPFLPMKVHKYRLVDIGVTSSVEYSNSILLTSLSFLVKIFFWLRSVRSFSHCLNYTSSLYTFLCCV